MRRSYKFLLRPTAGQARMLAEMLEDHRDLYNAALEERREAWRMQRVSVHYYSQCTQLKDIRAADHERYGRWAIQSERMTLRRLDQAFSAFYRRCRAGQKPGYPRFRGCGRWDSVKWEKNGNGCKWDSVPHPTVTRVYLMGIGHVRVHQHRPVKGRIKMVTVRRDCGRWYVFLSCDDVPAEPLEPTGAAIGIDMGTVRFITTSDGGYVPNPRYLRQSTEKLAAAQQELMRFPRVRSVRGTRKHRQAAAKAAAIHRKIRCQRRDHAHKTALNLVRDHDVIVHEKLQIQNMTRRPAPKFSNSGIYEHNGAACKAGPNRSILDAGWGIFLRVLGGKAESAGRTVITVNPRHTSQRCAQCGHTAAGNRVSQARFRCLACGHEAHADVNAAINILRAGLALREAQASREAA